MGATTGGLTLQEDDPLGLQSGWSLSSHLAWSQGAHLAISLRLMWCFLKNDEFGPSKYNQENRDAGMGCSTGEVYKISDLLGIIQNQG